MTPTASPVGARMAPMAEDAVRGLARLVQRRPDAIAVPALCTALLHDYCGTHKRECAALAHAVEEGIPGELLRGPGQVPGDVWFDGLIHRLVNSRAMSPDAAEWAATRWAEALGVPPPQAPAAAPGPPPAPPLPPGAPGAGLGKAPAPEAPTQEPLGGPPPPPARTPPAPRFRGAAVAVLVLAAVAGLYLLVREPAPRIHTIRFFEAAPDYRERGNAAGNPAATPSHFRQDETRAIWIEVTLARPVPQDTPLDAVWRLPDGTPKKDSIILSAGARQAIVGGHGWEEVGHWGVGTYAVEFSIAGKKIDSERFVIDPAPRDALSVKAVRFYESDGSYPPLDQRLYRTHFWQDATRYVNFQLDLDRPLQKHIDFMTRWYFPNAVKTGAYSTHSYSADPGTPYIGSGLMRRWEPGDYKVDVVANGVTIASKKFTVEPPLEAQSVGFYPSNPPAFPWLPLEVFPKESTTSVWYRLELSRPVAEDTTIVSVWHRPDGTEASHQTTLREGSKTASDGRESTQPGSLLAGTWRVDIFLDNKKLATRSFVVTEAVKPSGPSSPPPLPQSRGTASGSPKVKLNLPCPPGQHRIGSGFLKDLCVKD